MRNPYLEADVRTSRPEALVARLLEEAVRRARRAAAEGCSDRERLEASRRAIDIVCELRVSLDLEAGGEVAGNLDALYDFVGSRLLAGGAGDVNALCEAARVLAILSEAWRELAQAGDRGAA